MALIREGTKALVTSIAMQYGRQKATLNTLLLKTETQKIEKNKSSSRYNF
jgi:hypothetical protein